MTSEEQDERYLDVMLEEKLSGLEAPDLRHRVLSATPEVREQVVRRAGQAAGERSFKRSTLVAAAVLLLGLGATTAALWFDRDENPKSTPTSASQGEQGREKKEQGKESRPVEKQGREESQDKPNDHETRIPSRTAEFTEELIGKSVDPKRLAPKNLAEFVECLDSVESATIEFPDYRAKNPLAIGAELTKLLGALRAGLVVEKQTEGLIWANSIELRMKGGRYLRCAAHAGKEWRMFKCTGFPIMSMTPELTTVLVPMIERAKKLARLTEGIAFTRNDLIERPGGIASGIEQLTCHAIFDKDLALLSRFTRVSMLDLRGCSKLLDGSGMGEVAKLSSLRHILLNHTAIDDEALAKLGALPRLQQLNLWSATRITGTGFRAFARTDRLHRLNLGSVRDLNDAGLAAVASIRSLAHLNLAGRSLGRVTPTGLASLSKAVGLESLDLAECPVAVDKAVRAFGVLSKLTVLDLSDTSVSALGLSGLPFRNSGNINPAHPNYRRNHHPLRMLSLNGCVRVDDEALQHIADLQNLTELDLSKCAKITAAGLLHLTKLMQLTGLDLNRVQLGTEAFKRLATIPSLKQLDLRYTGADDAGLAHIANMRSVNELDLTGNAAITDRGLARLATMPKLGRLRLELCSGISAAGLQTLQAALPKCEITKTEAVWNERR